MKGIGWLMVAAAASTAMGQTQRDDPAMLQWFEIRWEHMERRAPDVFLAGYGSVWIPPVGRANSHLSVGYDPFDRFDLGSPGDETTYGTEQMFRAMIDELHQANVLVHVDGIFNHNAARDGSISFQEKGGYPGFWLNSEDPPVTKFPGGDWGDFHNGLGGDEITGDLLGLIDIAQEFNHQFVRHPVSTGDPMNIPAGSIHNLPDAANARLYPDLDLPGFTFFNPGTPNNPGFTPFTIHPYNTDEPLAGDPIPDNGTGLLMRWTQWMMDEFGVDGFRLDAAKHAPSWFWDTYWDSAVYLRRRTPAGSKVTPFSFVESVDSNDYTYNNYTRKGDGFGNRDALDVGGAGQLRDLVNADGLGSWQSVLASHIDNADDGFNNGTLGVNHVFSHDNGTVGDGGALPPLPTQKQQGFAATAYTVLRPGPPIVYHNARGIDRPFGFFPREGYPAAIGLDAATGQLDDTVTGLVAIRNLAGRGDIDVLNFSDPVDQSLDDVLVFERKAESNNGFTTMLLAAVNDRYDAGVEVRDVKTSFAPGTRLQEMTGNAADGTVDPGGVVPEVLVVGADQRVIITIPNNTSSAGEHHRGYVVYVPTLPTGVLEVSGVTGEIAADPAQAPDYLQRLNAVPIVDAATITLTLTTTQTDPLDDNTDDDAAFRLDQGFVDFNGDGDVDYPEFSATPGYERFLTVNEPLFGSDEDMGVYQQEIDASQLAEGYHYLSVVAFRHQQEGAAPLFQEWRSVFYLDRVGPAIEWIEEPISDDQHLFKVALLDRTATRVHFFRDLPDGADPVELADSLNMGFEHDRFEWRKTLVGLEHGFHTLTLVAFEESGNATVLEEPFFVDTCAADFDKDGGLTILDFVAFQGAFVGGDERADVNGDGVLNILDFVTFQGLFQAGCV